MAFIIGTAGHIDHGKTSLVKALTGQDTDRLKEEKARGISIDLGFAHLDLPNGERAGVIDVPGHERFVRNMLAGAHGIDLVLLTIAADDGVMPQTEEHLEIVRLLGVDRAIVVVTKVDLVSRERVQAVDHDVRALVAGSPFEGAPLVPCSVVTGEGLPELRAQISGMLTTHTKAVPPGLFRLPVDRVFLMRGHGLVVTGTARSGLLRTGDHVRILPGSQRVRVRGLQVHGQPVDEARWGQRVAINVSGADPESVGRGHVIVDERIDMVSDRFDAVLDGAWPRDRRSRRVRVHVGTAERLATLRRLDDPPGAPPIVGSAPPYAQFVLRGAVHLMRGDRFVVRDESAQKTVGGGRVLDAGARPARRRDPGRAAWLASLDRGTPDEVLRAFLGHEDDFAVPAPRIRDFLNVDDDAVVTIADRASGVRPIAADDGYLFTTDDKWHRIEAAVQGALAAAHADRPLAPGLDIEALRVAVAFRGTPRLFRTVLDGLASAGLVVREASVVRLPSHVVRMRADEEQLSARLLAALGATPLAPPTFAELEVALAVPRQKLLEVSRVLERAGTIIRVGSEFTFLATAVEHVKATLLSAFGDGQAVTPAAFRDRLGTSRKFVIPLLEYCDRAGFTVRRGESRSVNRTKLAASGPAPVPSPR